MRPVHIAVLMLTVVPAWTHAQVCENELSIGAVMLGGSVAWDIATAPLSARKYNRSNVSLAPVVDMRDRRVGLRFSLPLPGGGPRQSAPVLKSPEFALALSTAWSAGPVLFALARREMGFGNGALLAWSGLTFGPSVGHYYSEQTWPGTRGILLRIAASLVMVGEAIGCFES